MKKIILIDIKEDEKEDLHVTCTIDKENLKYCDIEKLHKMVEDFSGELYEQMHNNFIIEELFEIRGNKK